MLYGVREPRHHDSLDKILLATDAQKIANWLREQPLLHVDPERKLALCHAGIYPWWSLKKAKKRAADVEAVFQNEEKCLALLKKIYSNEPSKWSKGLSKTEQRRFTINAFTRMRFCSPDGHLDHTESGYQGKSTSKRVPWFNIPNKGLDGHKVVFGHWSALGLLNSDKFLCLDTGCVWGREMTMAKIPKELNKPITLYTQSNKKH